MGNNVVFEDYSFKCKDVIKQTAIQFLIEAGALIVSSTIRNQSAFNKTSQTSGSWQDAVIDESALSATIGNDYPNAIYEEFGTGEFAEMGSGRKGWWVYVKGGGTGTGGKSYASKSQAEKACAILRKKGLDAYYTQGKSARHHFLKAYTSEKSRIIKRAEQLFGGMS